MFGLWKEWADAYCFNRSFILEVNCSTMIKSKIVIPREVLLVEIERRCHVAGCNTRTLLALTKAEARAYCGFKCERCEEWNADGLSESDIPDWWVELTVTDLYAVRNTPGIGPDEPGEVISRMSDGYFLTKDGE